MKAGSVYFDYNATTPIAKEVSTAIVTALGEAWGNPSSPYEAGVKAKAVIEDSRQQIGKMIGAPASTIIFTSGGTESNNLAIHSSIQFYLKSHNQNSDVYHEPNRCKPHVITSNIEHDSILKPLKHMVEQNVINLSIVPVSKFTGCIDVEDVINEIHDDTCLVTVMMANNETGLVQPIAELGTRIALLNQKRSVMVLYHTDAAQTIGKMDVSVEDLKVHFLTIVGHKFYGPRIGAIYAKNLNKGPQILSPLLFGGGQEKGVRPGTENTAMISGLGKAAELVIENLDEYEKHMSKIRDYLENKLTLVFKPRVEFNNVRKGIGRLPNTTSVSFLFDKISGPEILSSSGVCASTGAACHDVTQTSVVLINSGIDEYSAARTLRLSVGRETTESEVDICISKLELAILG